MLLGDCRLRMIVQQTAFINLVTETRRINDRDRKQYMRTASEQNLDDRQSNYVVILHCNMPRMNMLNQQIMQIFFYLSGTSTWLTFITLTHNTGSNRLPKVNDRMSI